MIDWQSLSEKQRAEALQRPIMPDNEKLQAAVAEIIQSVRDSGDDALQVLTKRFDGIILDKFKVTQTEIESAIQSLDPRVLAAIDEASLMIHRFHVVQLQEDIEVETKPGVKCSLRIRPLQAVGLYVPGGRTPLVSTALMLGIPAQLAGCPRIILLSPPDHTGQMAPEIIYAASKCGIDSLFKVGGAQAIAAMAFGTESIPAVDKIFGPGNRYVTEAKRQVSQTQGLVGIDMPAGPSELLIIADGTAKARFIAADLLSQAEHGPDSQVILLATDVPLIKKIEIEISAQLTKLPRRKIATEALRHARFILVSNIREALKLSNCYAPEHLILNMENAESYLDEVHNAGSIFLGPWSPESAGDYASGTNHVLPTYGAARFTDSLSLKDFQKRSTVQHLTREGLDSLGETIMLLAEREGLTAHKHAITLRLEDLS